MSESNIIPPVRYTVGLDLGKLSDYTALAVAEEHPESWEEDLPRAVALPRWATDPTHQVTWLQRWPLRTPYHAIARDVGTILDTLWQRRPPASEVACFVDATGVGTAVIELLRAQPANARVPVQPVTITAGHETTRAHEAGAPAWHVPKRELVAAAQVALQGGRLKVAASLPEAAMLTQELRGFEVRVTESANQQFSHREGQHDDLVLAVALAVWGATRPRHVSHVFNYRTGPGRGVAPYGKNRHGGGDR